MLRGRTYFTLSPHSLHIFYSIVLGITKLERLSPDKSLHDWISCFRQDMRSRQLVSIIHNSAAAATTRHNRQVERRGVWLWLL